MKNNIVIGIIFLSFILYNRLWRLSISLEFTEMTNSSYYMLYVLIIIGFYQSYYSPLEKHLETALKKDGLWSNYYEDTLHEANKLIDNMKGKCYQELSNSSMLFKII